MREGLGRLEKRRSNTTSRSAVWMKRVAEEEET
jgi:hypothetical protein